MQNKVTHQRTLCGFLSVLFLFPYGCKPGTMTSAAPQMLFPGQHDSQLGNLKKLHFIWGTKPENIAILANHLIPSHEKLKELNGLLILDADLHEWAFKLQSLISRFGNQSHNETLQAQWGVLVALTKGYLDHDLTTKGAVAAAAWIETFDTLNLATAALRHTLIFGSQPQGDDGFWPLWQPFISAQRKRFESFLTQVEGETPFLSHTFLRLATLCETLIAETIARDPKSSTQRNSALNQPLGFALGPVGGPPGNAVQSFLSQMQAIGDDTKAAAQRRAQRGQQAGPPAQGTVSQTNGTAHMAVKGANTAAPSPGKGYSPVTLGGTPAHMQKRAQPQPAPSLAPVPGPQTYAQQLNQAQHSYQRNLNTPAVSQFRQAKTTQSTVTMKYEDSSKGVLASGNSTAGNAIATLDTPVMTPSGPVTPRQFWSAVADEINKDPARVKVLAQLKKDMGMAYARLEKQVDIELNAAYPTPGPERDAARADMLGAAREAMDRSFAEAVRYQFVSRMRGENPQDATVNFLSTAAGMSWGDVAKATAFNGASAFLAQTLVATITGLGSGKNWPVGSAVWEGAIGLWGGFAFFGILKGLNILNDSVHFMPPPQTQQLTPNLGIKNLGANDVLMAATGATVGFRVIQRLIGERSNGFRGGVYASVKEATAKKEIRTMGEHIAAGIRGATVHHAVARDAFVALAFLAAAAFRHLIANVIKHESQNPGVKLSAQDIVDNFDKFLPPSALADAGDGQNGLDLKNLLAPLIQNEFVYASTLIGIRGLVQGAVPLLWPKFGREVVDKMPVNEKSLFAKAGIKMNPTVRYGLHWGSFAAVTYVITYLMNQVWNEYVAPNLNAPKGTKK